MYKKLFIFFLLLLIIAIVTIVLYNKKTTTLPGNVIFEVEVLDQNGNRIFPTGKSVLKNDYTLDWKYYSFNIPKNETDAKSENLSIGNIINHGQAGVLINSGGPLSPTYLNILKDGVVIQTKFGNGVKDYPIDLNQPIVESTYRPPRFFYVYDVLKRALNTTDLSIISKSVKKVVFKIKSRDGRTSPFSSMSPGYAPGQYNEIDVDVQTKK